MRGTRARSILAELFPALFDLEPRIGLVFKGAGGKGGDDEDPPKDDDDDDKKGGKGKGGKDEDDEEDEDKKGGKGGDDDDDPEDKKGGKDGKDGEDDDEGEKVPRSKMERELARVRSSAARRIRRLEQDLRKTKAQLAGGDVDDEEDEDEEDDKKGGKGGKGGRANPQAALERQLAKEKAERRRLQEEVRTERTTAAIRTAAKAHGMYADDVVDILRGRLVFESEEPDAKAYVRSSDESGEAVELDIDEAVEELGRKRPHLRRKQKPAGSGSRGATRGGGSGGSGGGQGAKPKTFAEAEKAAATRLRDALSD